LIYFEDDFVIIAKTIKGHAFKVVEYVMTKLDLQLSMEKTRFVNMYGGKERFDFIGFYNRWCQMDPPKGNRY